MAQYVIVVPTVKGGNRSYWNYAAITSFEAESDEQAIAEFERLAQTRQLVSGGVNWASQALLCPHDSHIWIYPKVTEKEYKDRWYR